MGLSTFDRKFGRNFISDLPPTPGVYLFKNDSGDIIYVGKALNLRRRLQNYRNARRLKAHRKMKSIIRDASFLEIRNQTNEFDALVLENELIRKFRPKYNVDGAFQFLYPAFGIGQTEDQLYLCLTSNVDRYKGVTMTWFGCFRSRLRCKAAYESLVSLLSLLGHPEPTRLLKGKTGMRGAHLSAFRRINYLKRDLEGFLSGSHRELLLTLAKKLLQKAYARKNASEVQEHLNCLADFYTSDTERLSTVLKALGEPSRLVRQEERDILFINYRKILKTRLPTHRQAGKP